MKDIQADTYCATQIPYVADTEVLASTHDVVEAAARATSFTAFDATRYATWAVWYDAVHREDV